MSYEEGPGESLLGAVVTVVAFVALWALLVAVDASIPF